MDFEDYVKAHANGLMRFALLLCRDWHTAEDVVQEVLARAHRQWDRVSQASYPHAYVRRMIVNETLSWQRKWGRIEPRTDADLDGSICGAAGQSDDRDELVRALAALPGRQRAAIVLRYFEDLSDAEIADVMGCKQVTVRGHIHRALASMRISVTETAPTTQLSGRI